MHHFCNVMAVHTPARAVVVHDALRATPEVYVCEMPTEHAALAAHLHARRAPRRKQGTLACRGVVLQGDRGSLTVRPRVLEWDPLTPGLKARTLSLDAIEDVHASSSTALELCVRDGPAWELRFQDAADAARVAWLLRVPNASPLKKK